MGAPLISIFLIDSVVTDPVNAPKLFVLGIVSSGVAGSVIYGLNRVEIKRAKAPLIYLASFFILSIGTLFTSKAPIHQSLYGVYGRNNGLVAYIFFSLLFLGALFISAQSTHLKLIHGLFIAGIVNVVYCGWVITFGDFLSWNNPYGNILGTFGNPNFIGAFLGMFFSAWLAFLLGPKPSKYFKVASIFVLPFTAIEIYLSHAIQGRVLMAGGSVLVVFFWLLFKLKSKILLMGYVLVATFGAGLSLAGALQIGPLTKFIYKTSVSLRGQYWLSAWNTGQDNPLTGVGYDSLGDWYRRMRDPHALELPGINTVINTAHNVPLDIFAFGGWPLFISYLALVLLTLWKVVRFSINMKSYDQTFIALAVSWICYQLQSIISINQIGLGFWGWLLSGALLSYTQIGNQVESEDLRDLKMSNARKIKSQEKVVGAGMFSGIAMVIGALIAVPPLASDMKWMSAQKSRDAVQLELTLKSGYLNPQNMQKFFMTIDAFEQSNFTDLSHRYALEAVKFNPDSFDAWRLLSLLKKSSAEEKDLALQNMRRLDPLNPTLKSAP